MLHDLKAIEHLRTRRTGPRTLVLAPMHEVAHRLAGFGKALVHHDRLRVQTPRAFINVSALVWAGSEVLANQHPGNGR